MSESRRAPRDFGLEPKRPEEVREILRRLRAGLEILYGPRLRSLYLFGSYARDRAVAGSDLDVLVVLDEMASSWEEIQRTSELTAELSLAYDVTVCSVFTTERRWEDGETALVRTVQGEGVPV